MGKVAISGASGFVGSHLLGRLQASAWEAIPLVRKASGLVGEQVIGPLEGAAATTLPPLDAFMHLAARAHVMNEIESDPIKAYRQTNVMGTLAALEMAHRAGARQFVFLSSVKAMGEETQPGAPFTEASKAEPEDAYGVTKLEAEQAVIKFCETNKMAWSIVRSPLVYGAGVKANFMALAKLVRTGLPLPLGGVHNSRSLVYVRNLTDFLAFALDESAAQDRLFLLDDGAPLSSSDMLRLMARANSQPSRLFSIGEAAPRILLSVIGKRAIYRRLFGNLETDSRAARNIGWNPPFTAEEGFRETLKG